MSVNWDFSASSSTRITAPPSTELANPDKGFILQIRMLPLSVLNSSGEVLENFLKAPRMSNYALHPEPTLPTFDRSWSYNGSIPASRWLLRLRHNFRRAGRDPPSGALYPAAIKMLVDGDVADRLSATPRKIRIISIGKMPDPKTHMKSASG